MQIKVGLRAADLVSPNVREAFVSSSSSFILESVGGCEETFPGPVNMSAQQGMLVLRAGNTIRRLPSVSLFSAELPEKIAPYLMLVLKDKHGQKVYKELSGKLHVTAAGDNLKVILECDLETYVEHVLQAEVPPSYHLQALRAQCVLARTYALRPRLSHEHENFNVCDSYLCCQAFNGDRSRLLPSSLAAIKETRDEVLWWQDGPALALFSSSAGGHTESYANCFSDPKTGRFPELAIPYLTGVSEGNMPGELNQEPVLRKLFYGPLPQTADSWSPVFRWSVDFSAAALEGYMHHQVEKMMANTDFSPYVCSPASGQFGHIKSFRVNKRGISGTAMNLLVATSKGDWEFQKELVIRSVFKNPELKIARLRSAKIFFEQHTDRLGLLAKVTIRGFGFGHGVGLQQTGAQGHARQGKNYRQILAHYYPGTTLRKVSSAKS